MPSITGLTAAEVNARRAAGQTNTPPKSQTKTTGEIVRDNICTYFNLVFLVLAVMLALVRSWLNMGFLGIVFCNTLIGIVQQLRAKRTIDKLTLVSAQKIRCLRDGRWCEVLSDDLVQDDVVEFGAGDQIVADAVVLDGSAQANESLITGEARAVPKECGAELKSGSFLMAGRCVARLTHVGAESYASRLTAEAQANGHKVARGEMMRSLDKLIKFIGIALVPIGAVLIWKQHWVLELPMKDTVDATVAALIGMIPEGLYLLTSVALAVSMMRLARRKVLTRDMNCIETLALGTSLLITFYVEVCSMLVNATNMLLKARDGHYAVGQFNINNLEWTKSVLLTAQEMNSPVILGVSEGAGKYMTGFKTVAAMVKAMDESLGITVPVALHLDHGTYEGAKACVAAGFTSIMFDGSHYDIDENVAKTTELVALAHDHGLSIEAEVGSIGGEEDGVIGMGEVADPAECAKIAALGIDFLAAGIGNIHGKYPANWQGLNFEALDKIHNATDNIPLVLHGGTGIPADMIRKAISLGVSKINVNTECQLSFADATRKYIEAGKDLQGKGFDPRKLLAPGAEAIKATVREKIELFGSANKA